MVLFLLFVFYLFGSLELDTVKPRVDVGFSTDTTGACMTEALVHTGVVAHKG